MSNPLGINRRIVETPRPVRVEHVIVQRPLARVLEFTQKSIHDVINDSAAHNEVRAYFKLQKWIHRGIEISELERQWNRFPV